MRGISYSGLFIVAGIVGLAAAGCSQPPAPENSMSAAVPAASVREEPDTARFVPTDTALAPFRRDLLQTAFEVASLIPLNPHVKDRSRQQDKVIQACLQLEQPQLALTYIREIKNWRQGTAYADLAMYYARHGADDASIQQMLDLAINALDAEQDWRKDRIKGKVAQVYEWVGEHELADEFGTNLVESETGKLAATRAIRSEDIPFDEQLATMEQLISQGNLDIIVNALQAGVHLFDRFYDDEQRRGLLEEKIKANWTQAPVFIRINILLDMAAAALAHRDMEKSLALVNEAQGYFDDYTWPPENYMLTAAKIITQRFLSGDREKARADADAVREFYTEKSELIVNIYRAEPLRLLAEAYQTMGDTAAALDVCKLAVEAGMLNPNSRPRAEDLSSTCMCLAVQGIEPDEALRRRIRDIQSGLDEPW